MTKKKAHNGLPLLRSYPAPWEGHLLLACRKCQRKLKRSGQKGALAKLSKTLKRRTRRREAGPMFSVIQVSCLDLCPKGGVTVCTQQQLANNECSILRTSADVNALVEQYTLQGTMPNTEQ